MGLAPSIDLLRVRRDAGARRRFHPVAEVKARLRRLVVADILPGHAQPVLRVVHQSVKAVCGRDRRRVDAQFLVVGRPPDDFFAPVAENIRAKGGGGFGAVVRGASVSGEQSGFGFFQPVLFGDAIAIQKFAKRIGVPPHAKIAGVGFAF